MGNVEKLINHISNSGFNLDDVLTTGSSANECTKALLAEGAKEVYVFTFAASSLS